MARYGTLGSYRFPDPEESASDIRGSKVYGPNDEKLGEIDDVIFDHATCSIVYVIVDTGGWLSSHKFIVPPDKFRPSPQHKDDYLVDLSKRQIESFPPFDHTVVTSEQKWTDYENRYRSKWAEGPVMHRVATDRNITPTTMQQIGSGAGTFPSAADEDSGEPITPVWSEAAMDISASGPALNWTTFEDRIRQRREEVLESSIRLAKREEGQMALEKERDEPRKAS